MKESLPDGIQLSAAASDATTQVAAPPAPSPEDGADPDQYLWGV